MFSIARTATLVPLALLATACMPKTNMRVLQPASVDVPSDIQVVGVIDRSGPRNAGEHVLGTLEGIVTGEQIGADRQGREAAIEAAIRVLEESPRFEVVRVEARGRNGGGLFDRQLDADTVERLCARQGCDALLALEAFDSDSWVSIDGVRVSSLTNVDQLKREVADIDLDDVRAESDTQVMASWRMYDADGTGVVDELRDRDRHFRWQGSGALTDVRRAIPGPNNRVARAGTEAGGAYAARIAPSYQWVQRRYFSSGDPRTPRRPPVRPGRRLGRCGTHLGRSARPSEAACPGQGCVQPGTRQRG